MHLGARGSVDCVTWSFCTCVRLSLGLTVLAKTDYMEDLGARTGDQSAVIQYFVRVRN